MLKVRLETMTWHEMSVAYCSPCPNADYTYLHRVAPSISPETCKIFPQVFSPTFLLTILMVLVPSTSLLVSLLSPFPGL